MTDSAREARNAYMRAWRAKNKEKEKNAREAYWERKAAEQSREEQTAEKTFYIT